MSKWNLVRNKLCGLNILEIGGPSSLFENGSCKLYDIFNEITLGNIFENNPWQKNIEDCYVYGKLRNRFNIDVTNIININVLFDSVITSHVFEHIANPIKSIFNINNIIRKNGYILTIVPNKDYCWDVKRPFVTFEHLVEDYNNNINENDLTHFKEIVDCGAFPPRNDYIPLSEINESTRIVHHHCFSLDSLEKIHSFAGFKTIDCFNFQEDVLQYIYLGKKGD